MVAGRYRVKLSGSANSVTLAFTVTPPRTNKPEIGHWVSTSLSGPVSGVGGSTNPGDSVTATRIFFDVVSGGASISGFGFNYQYSGPGTTSGTNCSGSHSTTDQAAAPITNGQFSTPAQNSWSDVSYGTFSGTFDSPTRAHGTAWLRGYVGAFDCRLLGFANTGEFAWAAVRQP